MKSRAVVVRVATACVVLVAVVVLIGLLVPSPPREPGVTPENFRRLRVGMSRHEAEETLGASRFVVEVDDMHVRDWTPTGPYAVSITFRVTEGNGHLLERGQLTKDGKRVGSIGEPPVSWREWITDRLGF